MPAWSSSSLAASDGMSRHHSSGLLKHTAERLSKQSLHEKKMFGSRKGRHGKDFKVGSKMFRKKGKGVMHGAVGSKHGGISPSVEEFDDMLASAGGGKKKMFSRKSFG